MAVFLSPHPLAVVRSFSQLHTTKHPLLACPAKLYPFPPHLHYLSTIVCSRRPNTHDPVTSSKMGTQSYDATEDDYEEDAFEKLFKQLEVDLQNDDHSRDDSEEEINEEDLVKLEHELNEFAGDDELLQTAVLAGSDAKSDIGVVENDDSDEEEPMILKTWQLRRLGSALKIGRRKTNIKSLAADVCLDRAVVLKLLRDPPPNLLLMSASLPDEREPTIKAQETQLKEIPRVKNHVDAQKEKANEKLPVHMLQKQWSARKRLKKMQIVTLERVYQRTKRPTGAMVGSIVHVTNLPRKRVVKWFEEKRREEGLPHHYLPHRWSAPGNTFAK